MYRQYVVVQEYWKCRESGRQAPECLKLLVESILQAFRVRIGNRYRKYADAFSLTVNNEHRIPDGSRRNL